MQLRLLGPLELADGDTPVPPGGPRLRTLLAVLGVNAGHTVSVAAISDALWGDDAPAAAANALQQLVSKLRRVLPNGVLTTEPTGYRLDIADDDLDVRVFERLATEGRARLDRDDAPGAARCFGDALALWRGAPLADFDGDEWARTDIARLSELQIAVHEDHIAARLALGQHAQAVSEIEVLISQFPLRERLRGQLMLALYGSGRQADALRAYQQAREMLADELGLEPGPELRAIEARILEQDESLNVVAVRPVSGNLPAAMSSLVGRVDDVRAITDALEETRVLTLVGPGGAGKTRLSLEAARALEPSVPDGVWYVELAALTDPDAVPMAIADTLGVSLAPDGRGLDVLGRVVEFLSAKRAVILLDNCEHLIDAAAAAVVRLAERCAGVRILATSREGLGVTGERLQPVPPLPPEDACALFVLRMQAVAPHLDVDDENEPLIAEICARLDGLPLAIELAAARVRALSIAEIATRLDRRFRLLTGGARTALPRHRTLQAVVDWSYEMLFDDERRLFERLTVFTDGCTLAAAEAVCGDGDLPREEVADLLVHIVDKSLVVADPTAARFSMLQTLADYGRERLHAAGESAALRERHADYYAALCDASEAAYNGERQLEWLDEARGELENLRAAFEWSLETGNAQRASHIAVGLGWVFWIGGRTAEGLALIERAMACSGEVEPRTLAYTYTWHAWLSFGNGKPVPDAMSPEMLAAFDAVDDDDFLAQTRLTLGEANFLSGNRDVGRSFFEQSQALYRRRRNTGSLPTMGHLADMRVAQLNGQQEEAEAAAHRAIASAAAHGDHVGTALACSLLGELTDARGAFDDTRAALERGRVETAAAGLWGADTVTLGRLASMEILAGNYERAAELQDEMLTRTRRQAAPTQMGVAYVSTALRCRRQGRLDDADAAARAAHEIFATAPGTSWWVSTQSSLGYLAEARGDADAADAWHRAILPVGDAQANRATTALALEGLAGVALLRADAPLAARLLGAAAASRKRAGSVLHGTARLDVEGAETAARAELGDAGYAAAFAEGADQDAAALVALSS